MGAAEVPPAPLVRQVLRGEVMGWLFWTIIGIAAAAVLMFFLSCAWLNHFLDGIDERRHE